MKKINLCDENGQRHGYWVRHFDNDQLGYKGYYRNGNEVGYWVEMFNTIKTFYLR